MTLADDIRACTLCPLAGKQEAGAQHVPATVGARYRPGGIAVVFDAPTYYDAKDGKYLAGKNGALFDSLAAEAGLSREDIVVLGAVRCRPPNNRLRDYPEAVANCAVWTKAELDLYQPKVMVLMGSEAIKTGFGADATVARSRGQFLATPAKHPWGWRTATAAYNPAAAAFAGGADSEIGRQIVSDLVGAKRALELLREVNI